jgi:succinate dehydrogenase/fumarate reductase flavoprotein subunit
MWEKVGLFRTAQALTNALTRVRAMRERDLPASTVSSERVHNGSLVEWFELHNGLLAAEALAMSALQRRESRGAHQRDDFPETRREYERNQRVWLADGKLVSSFEGLLQ